MAYLTVALLGAASDGSIDVRNRFVIFCWRGDVLSEVEHLSVDSVSSMGPFHVLIHL